MRSTLFFIPHQLGPLPILGFGWVLIAIVIGFLFLIVARRSGGQSWLDASRDWLSWSIAVAVVVFVLPRIETYYPDRNGGFYPVGLPVRGYGLFLMAGVVGAVWLTNLRATKIGLSLDGLMSLSLFTVIGGIVGARLFYVIQKWSELPGSTLMEKLIEAVKFTEGGLVVFGSFIGGALAVILWSVRRRYRLLVLGDLIVAGLMLGLCLGRLGCFMNGCCYGGVCDSPPGLAFPRGSLAYMDQLQSGELLGLNLETSTDSKWPRIVEKVRPQSWASSEKIKPGSRVESIRAITEPPDLGSDPAGPLRVVAEITVDGRLYRIIDPLPSHSLPIHPTQLYASLNAALICGFLFFLWPNTLRDGVVLGAWLVMCGTSRMLEEWIRVDELGQFGTSLTIAQWISLFGIVGGLILLSFVWKRPLGRHALPI
jgi:phosphatidylglycerol:prolipoprotein diacylglycerol transferase